MKKLLFILCLLFSLNVNSQNCVTGQAGVITPAGPYTPGQVVTVDYTLYGWNQISTKSRCEDYCGN